MKLMSFYNNGAYRIDRRISFTIEVRKILGSSEHLRFQSEIHAMHNVNHKVKQQLNIQDTHWTILHSGFSY